MRLNFAHLGIPDHLAPGLALESLLVPIFGSLPTLCLIDSFLFSLPFSTCEAFIKP